MTTGEEKVSEGPSKPIVGIFISPELLEDWLEHIDISFEAFLSEMMGSWIFGYIESLKLAGIEPVMLCVSNRVSVTACFSHRPTGAMICILPATRLHKFLRQVRRVSADLNFKGAYVIKGGLRILCEYISTPIMPFRHELRRGGYAAILVQDYETARFDICVMLGKLSGVPVYGTFQGGAPSRK
ncbi:MAG: hypothetical protein OEV08_05535, partial [Nitrospira sp.]|nr:hypothetical protein [Nitrospira sp.]